MLLQKSTIMQGVSGVLSGLPVAVGLSLVASLFDVVRQGAACNRLQCGCECHRTLLCSIPLYMHISGQSWPLGKFKDERLSIFITAIL